MVEPATEPYDVCVVGAGPIGLAVALEIAKDHQRVVVVEAGADASRPGEARQATFGMELTYPEHHARLDQIGRVGVGGSSWIWGGRCVNFASSEFERRPWIPNSGWPISADDVAPWIEAAARYLDCDPAIFSSDSDRWLGLESVTVNQIERWSRRPQVGLRLRRDVARSEYITVLADSTVNSMSIVDDEVHSLSVLQGERSCAIIARRYVISAGGLQTTRLLLNVQRDHPQCFGGIDGPLGRYYMGHLFGSIASIRFNNTVDLNEFDFVLDEWGVYTRRRFSLTPEIRRTEKLAASSFSVDNLELGDSGHGNGPLSLLYLLLALPVVGRLMAQPQNRRRLLLALVGSNREHMRNVLHQPVRAATQVGRVFRTRYLSRNRLMAYLIPNPDGRYMLRYHAEQVPSAENRVTLSDGIDEDGLAGLRIKFKYSDQDMDSVVRSHELLEQALRASGTAELEWVDEVDLRERIRRQAADGYHQLGTTRMSSEPELGVVDEDCRVHGLANLFVASSSVFTTSGEANPTFMTMCLALRLADHLRH